MIVLVQALSGTDPLRPPNFNPRLVGGGKFLELSVPVSRVLRDADLLVNRNASWMSSSVGPYENTKQTRLGGLGPAIAQVNTHFQGQDWFTTWKIPLAEVCDEIVDNYSICNFRTSANRAGQRFYPVLVEFKLKAIEQSVKKEAKINCGVWLDSDSGESSFDDDMNRRLARISKKHKARYAATTMKDP